MRFSTLSMRPMARSRPPDAATTATQALLLINGDWTLARAKALANRLEQLTPESADARERIALAYRMTSAALPSPEDLDQAQAFLDRQTPLARAAGAILERAPSITRPLSISVMHC